MIDWVTELENYKTQIFRYEPEAQHYHYKNNQSDTLVITAGDSWTWGDSLDPDLRLTQVYGNLIASHFQADWINIGCCGWSNSWVLLHPKYIIDQLKNSLQYKKIYVILTLTENARDIQTPVSHPYDFRKNYYTLGVTDKFYQSVLDDCEARWAEQINDMVNLADDRYCFLLGQNFVWNQLVIDNIPTQVIVPELNWIETLADYQMLPRPIRTNLVTGWIFNTLEQINQIASISDHSVYQNWSLGLIEQALEVNKWLDTSELNCNQSSKHPNAVGHQVWAKYLIEKIENHG